MSSIKNMVWEELSSLPAPRVYTSVCSFNGIIYLIGGCDTVGQPVDCANAFDTRLKTWATLPNMPTKRAAPIIEVLNNKIIAVGGVGVNQQPVDAVEVFDIEKNEWIVMPKLSEALMGMGQVFYESKLYILGGMAVDTNPREHLKCVEFTNKQGQLSTKWQAFTPMPTARYALKAFLRNNKIYAVGGRSGKIPVCAFEVYDLSTYSWTKYPSLISKRVFQCYVMTDKFIVSLGGLKQDVQNAFTDNCEIYNITEDEKGSWVTNKRMSIPTKRGDFSASTIDNKVIVVGGLGNQRYPLGSVEAFDPDTKKWSRLADCVRPHSTAATIVVNGNFYSIGGISKDGPSNGCEVFKLTHENGSV